METLVTTPSSENSDTRPAFERSSSPSPSNSTARWEPDLPTPPLGDMFNPPINHPPPPWALHPIVDGTLRWGDVVPSRAEEMVQASSIARFFGDRKKLGLPEKAPLPPLESMKEDIALSEAKDKRSVATQEIKHIHKQLRQLKLSPSLIINVQREEITALITSLTDNFHMAFSPNPKLPPEGIDPGMAQLFMDLVDLYTTQLQEGMELVARMALMSSEEAQRSSDITKDNNPFGEVPDVKMAEAGWHNYRCRNCEYATSSDSSKSLSFDTTILPATKAGKFCKAYGERRWNALGPVIGRIGHFLATESSTPQQIKNDSVSNSETIQRELKLRKDIQKVKIEKSSLQLALKVAKEDLLRTEKQLQQMRKDRANNKDQVEIARLTNKIDRLRRQHEILYIETATNNRHSPIQLEKEATLRAMLNSAESEMESEKVDAMSIDKSDQTMYDVDLLPTLQDQVVELQKQIDTLKNEILDVQRDRDIAIRNADAAESRIQELKEEVAALHPGGDGLEAAQTRQLRARDRRISDLIAVRDNLRAEVIKRQGRVVGVHGEVTRERYDPARWKEAGRREQEGRPRLYRDVWGPEGKNNLLRKDWPPEYKPGSPVGERHDGAFSNEVALEERLKRALQLFNSEREEDGNVTAHGDKIEEAMASLWYEITTAYQGLREMFPEIETGEHECLAGLTRIVREKRRQVEKEINELCAKKKTLNFTFKDLKSLLRNAGIRGGGENYSLDQTHCGIEDPRPSIPRSLFSNNSSTGVGNEGDDEYSQSSSSCHIPESLCCNSSGSSYTPPGSPPDLWPESPPLFGDEDGEDAGNPGITGQGVVQMPVGQELAGLVRSGQDEEELYGALMPNDFQQGSAPQSGHSVIAPRDARKAHPATRRPNRDLKEPDLDGPGPSRLDSTDSTTVGMAQSVGCRGALGPTSMESRFANINRPNRRRRDSLSTDEGQVEPESPVGVNDRQKCRPRAPTRAGTRTTRNPAPVYCAPPLRKRKATEPVEGEPPKKKR